MLYRRIYAPERRPARVAARAFIGVLSPVCTGAVIPDVVTPVRDAFAVLARFSVFWVVVTVNV